MKKIIWTGLTLIILFSFMIFYMSLPKPVELLSANPITYKDGILSFTPQAPNGVSIVDYKVETIQPKGLLITIYGKLAPSTDTFTFRSIVLDLKGKDVESIYIKGRFNEKKLIWPFVQESKSNLLMPPTPPAAPLVAPPVAPPK